MKGTVATVNLLLSHMRGVNNAHVLVLCSKATRQELVERLAAEGVAFVVEGHTKEPVGTLENLHGGKGEIRFSKSD